MGVFLLRDMGDRFALEGLKCGHCGEPQEEVYFAESSGLTTHICEKCGKNNEIVQGFHLRAILEELK